jgi:hypothetical protein
VRSRRYRGSLQNRGAEAGHQAGEIAVAVPAHDGERRLVAGEVRLHLLAEVRAWNTRRSRWFGQSLIQSWMVSPPVP